MKRRVVSILLFILLVFNMSMLIACDMLQGDIKDNESESASVTYVMYGGTNDASNPTAIHSNDEYPIRLSDPVKEGYTFVGWFSNGEYVKSIDSCTPQTIYAAWCKNDDNDTRLTTDEVKVIVNNYQKAEYASAEDMFREELALGYLDSATDGVLSIYVNRYTGVLYYRNDITGEMVTSNPCNFTGAESEVNKLSSQIVVNYETNSTGKTIKSYCSCDWAAKYNQITVSKIDNGLRVNYVIGDAATRCLLPIMIEAHEFENDILRPMFETLYKEMLNKLGSEYAINYFDDNVKYYDEETVYSEKFIHTNSIRKYTNSFAKKIYEYESYVKANNQNKIPTEERLKINSIVAVMDAINAVYNSYQPYNPTHEEFKFTDNTPTICSEGYSVYKVKDTDYSQMAVKAKLIKKYCPNYTFKMLHEDEMFCKYKFEYQPKPVFECVLEYTFNDDGSLSVNFSSESVMYNNVDYVIKNIDYLKYLYENCVIDDGQIYLSSEKNSFD